MPSRKRKRRRITKAENSQIEALLLKNWTNDCTTIVFIFQIRQYTSNLQLNTNTPSFSKSVGQTKKEESAQPTSLKNLNDLLRSLASGDQTINSHVSRALDEFVSTVLPAHCQQIQRMQEDFFNNVKKSTNLKLNTQTSEAFQELMSSMMPAVCGKETAKNLVSKSATTNSLFDQLDRFGDLLKLNEKKLDAALTADTAQT